MGHVDASGGYGMSYVHHGSPVDSNVLPPRLAVSAPSFRGGVRGRMDSLYGSSADSAVMPPSHRPDSVAERESAEHHVAQPRVRGSAPLPMRGVSMNPVCRPSRGPARGRGDAPGDGRLNAFVSVSRLPEHIPFLPLFLLLEVYGTVQTMRRNQRNHEIVMVKMGSVAEAQTVVRCLYQTPFYESTVSGRAFANYVGPSSAISKDGDPRDPSCWQFDFVDYPASAALCTMPSVTRSNVAHALLTQRGCHGWASAFLFRLTWVRAIVGALSWTTDLQSQLSWPAS